MKKLESPSKMNLLNIVKNKLKVFFRLFSSKSKIDAKSARNEARKLMQIKPTKIVKVKSIYFPPKIQPVKKISLGQGTLYQKLITPDEIELIKSRLQIKILNQNDIQNLKPGYVFDTNVLMHFEDYADLLSNADKLVKKLSNKPIYVLSTTKKEFSNKQCPLNEYELIRDTKFSGEKRNFEYILKKLPSSLKTDIYFVNIEKCKDVISEAAKMLPDLKAWGLHKADSQFLSFSKLTKSTLITCDKDLIRSCNIARCNVIDFACFCEKILQPSPLTVRERNTRILRNRSKDGKNRGAWK